MSEIEKDHVNYDIAVGLKEIGFNLPCLSYFRKDSKRLITEFEVYHTPDHCIGVPAPTLSAVFRWFRNMYGFYIRYFEPYENLSYPSNKWRASIHNMNRLFKNYTNLRYIIGDNYEEVETKCLEQLIKIVKNKEI